MSLGGSAPAAVEEAPVQATAAAGESESAPAAAEDDSAPAPAAAGTRCLIIIINTTSIAPITYQYITLVSIPFAIAQIFRALERRRRDGAGVAGRPRQRHRAGRGGRLLRRLQEQGLHHHLRRRAPKLITTC